jgi:hypothetical protein
MRPSITRRGRLVKRIALGVTACAVVAPSALAMPAPVPSSSLPVTVETSQSETSIPAGWGMDANEYRARLAAYETWQQRGAGPTGSTLVATGLEDAPPARSIPGVVATAPEVLEGAQPANPGLDPKKLAPLFAAEQEYFARVHAYQRWQQANGGADAVAKPAGELPAADTGSDWGNAAMYAGIGIAVAALLGIAILVSRRRTTLGHA